MILVTGGTGRVGRHVVSALHEAGAPVRVLSRTPSDATVPDGVELVGGDLSSAETLEPVLRDVDAVFFIWPQPTAIDPLAAVRAITGRVGRVVYLSSSTVEDDRREQRHPMTAIHADIERAVARSGVEWTFVRVGKIASNALYWAAQIRETRTVRLPFPEAGRSPIVESDIGEVGARALLEDGHARLTHVLSGPEALTEGRLVHIVGEAAGIAVEVDRIPSEVARAELIAQGSSPEVADAALALWERLVTDPEPVTPAVRDITGSSGTTFREWAEENAPAFR